MYCFPFRCFFTVSYAITIYLLWNRIQKVQGKIKNVKKYIVKRRYSKLKNIRDFFSPLAHPAIAIYELGLLCDPRMMSRKFRNAISNSAGVIVLTDKQANKPVGDWTPRLAQISLSWQQGSAPQHCAWFHWISHPRKPPSRCKHLRSICRTRRFIGDFVQILWSKFRALGGLNQKSKNNVL